jgi:hypothetical protein
MNFGHSEQNRRDPGQTNMVDAGHNADGRILRSACTLFVLGMVYALSIGPVTKLACAGYLPRKIVDAIYAPLNVVNGTPLETVRLRYLELWFPPSYIGDFPESRAVW